MATPDFNNILNTRIAERRARLSQVRTYEMVQVGWNEYDRTIRSMKDIPVWSQDSTYWLLKDNAKSAVVALCLDAGVIMVHARDIRGIGMLDREMVDNHLVPFLKELTAGHEQNLDDMDYLSGKLGYLVDVKGNWHHVSELPDGFTMEGDLDLSYWKPEDMPKLPKNMTIKGMLRVGEPMEALPEGLTVDVLVIDGKTITSFPAGLKVREELEYDKDIISEFPDDMRVKGRAPRVSRSRSM